MIFITVAFYGVFPIANLLLGQMLAKVVLSIVLLVAALGAALWVASRIYRAGVLLYGQRPGVRAVWHLMRSGV